MSERAINDLFPIVVLREKYEFFLIPTNTWDCRIKMVLTTDALHSAGDRQGVFNVFIKVMLSMAGAKGGGTKY